MRSWPRCALLVGVLAASVPVAAHVDPPGCSESGVALVVSLYRGDGKTGLFGQASECERLQYRVTLQKAARSACAVGGGTLALTTPDGIVHTLRVGVPCFGGTAHAAGSTDGDPGACDPKTTVFASDPVTYTVRPGDAVDGILFAKARYEGGVVHDNEPDTPGITVAADRRAELIACDDADPSTTDRCDPEKPGAAACSHLAHVDAEPCTAPFTPVEPSSPACPP